MASISASASWQRLASASSRRPMAAMAFAHLRDDRAHFVQFFVELPDDVLIHHGLRPRLRVVGLPAQPKRPVM
jgi:hypothetical protein